jgi:hypothetical protein
MTPEDHQTLERALPVGSVAIISRGFGNCRITSTAARNVWREQYFNSMNTLILNTIEVVDVPEVALAAPEDLDDTRARRDLARRGHRVLEVEDHRVGGQRQAFLDPPCVVARREQQGPEHLVALEVGGRPAPRMRDGNAFGHGMVLVMDRPRARTASSRRIAPRGGGLHHPVVLRHGLMGSDPALAPDGAIAQVAPGDAGHDAGVDRLDIDPKDRAADVVRGDHLRDDEVFCLSTGRAAVHLVSSSLFGWTAFIRRSVPPPALRPPCV